MGLSEQIPGGGSVDPADHPPQDFTDDQWCAFCDQAQTLGLPAMDPYRAAFAALHGHLVGVNRWLNLTRVAGPEAYLQRHVLDSLMIYALPWFAQATAPECCDLGSGGGYPGLPLAATHATSRWLLVDSRARKVRFLQAAGQLIDPERVRARAFRGREVASVAADEAERFTVVTTRATGEVVAMAEESYGLLQPGGRLVIWQGPRFTEASAVACRQQLSRKRWSHIQCHRYRLAAVDPDRVLVILTKTDGVRG